MTDARSPAERRLAEARRRVLAVLTTHRAPSPGPCTCCDRAVDELIAAARAAERDRLLAGQYDADVDPGR